MSQIDSDGTDGDQTAWRSRRGRRAAALIALAAITVIAAGYAYLRPALTYTAKTAPPRTTSQLVRPQGDIILYSVVNPSLAWALVAEINPSSDQGHFWIFVTVDGAKHWRRQLAGESSFIGMTITSFQFLDPMNGRFAAGNPLKLYRTGDGGGHWNVVGLPEPNAYELTFSDPQHGWLVARPTSKPTGDQTPHLYSTGDGGSTWRKLPDPPSDSWGLTFRAPSEGWRGSSTTDQAHVYATNDGGVSWRRHDLPVGGFPTGTRLDARVVLLPGSGVVAFLEAPHSDFGFTSFDGGNAWRVVSPRPGGVSFGVTIGFQDALKWWAIDGGILYKSSDAGQTWTQVTSPKAGAPNFILLLRILDPETAWAIINFPDGSGLGITEDGGLHWARVQVPQPA